MEKAKAKLDLTLTLRNALPEFFSGWDPMKPEMQAALDHGYYEINLNEITCYMHILSCLAYPCRFPATISAAVRYPTLTKKIKV